MATARGTGVIRGIGIRGTGTTGTTDHTGITTIITIIITITHTITGTIRVPPTLLTQESR